MRIFLISSAYCFTCLLSSPGAWAQQTEEYCTPSVVGLPRTKGLILKYEMITDYKITSDGKNGYSDADAEVTKNSRAEIKLRFPVINKPSLVIAGGLSYFQEEFHFDDPSASSYPIYQGLEDKDLRSAGVQLYMIKPTRTNKYFLLRASADLNGDFTEKGIDKSKFLKVSVAPLLGWKKNDNLSYAVGFAYGYIFGRPSFYPLLSYNRNFNAEWGVESLLPVNIKLRYSKNEKTFWYGIAEIRGASYRLSNKIPGLTTVENPHVHRSELRAIISFEREIHNWLWFGIEGGLRQNLQLNLTNSPHRNGEVLIKNKQGLAPLMNISLFLVPPRHWNKE